MADSLEYRESGQDKKAKAANSRQDVLKQGMINNAPAGGLGAVARAVAAQKSGAVTPTPAPMVKPAVAPTPTPSSMPQYINSPFDASK